MTTQTERQVIFAAGLVAVAKRSMGDPEQWRPGYGLMNGDPGPIDRQAMWAFGEAAVFDFLEATEAFTGVTGMLEITE